METEGRRESDNVEDRRGQGGGGGGGGGMRVGGRGIGIGSIAIALVASVVFGINPLTVLGILSGGGGPAPQVSQGPAAKPPKDDQMAGFVSKVLADTEDVWGTMFKQGGAAYKQPKLVLFRGSTPTACGAGQAAMGPFYCPGDQKVYIDLGFYETMKRQLGAPGDFAQAYVIAHEIGHHVQNQLGISAKVDAMRGRISEKEQNVLSVRLELQADCFAGVWAHGSKLNLDKGDIEEALNAAAQIGDDTLQKKSQGYAQPDSFTHGSSKQRMTWFNAGLQSGNMKQCDTFSAKAL
jgi:predicted metalloprotease